MVESSLHLQKVADRERKKAMKEEDDKKEEEQKKAKELEAKRHDAEDWLEYVKLFAIDIGTEVQRYANREPTNFILILIFMMLFMISWRIGTLQSQVYYLQQAQTEQSSVDQEEMRKLIKELMDKLN